MAVGGGVLDMIVGRDDEFECQAKRKSQHWANYDAGADADAPSCSLIFFPTIFTSGSALPSLFRKPAPVAVVRLTFL